MIETAGSHHNDSESQLQGSNGGHVEVIKTAEGLHDDLESPIQCSNDGYVEVIALAVHEPFPAPVASRDARLLRVPPVHRREDRMLRVSLAPRREALLVPRPVLQGNLERQAITMTLLSSTEHKQQPHAGFEG